MSRLPHFLDYWFTDGGEAVSLTRRPPFTPRKISEDAQFIGYGHLMYLVKNVTVEQVLSNIKTVKQASELLILGLLGLLLMLILFLGPCTVWMWAMFSTFPS
jgi:hypothetical protein